MLSHLQNKPLLQWVWEAAHKAAVFDAVVFAIDAPETARLIESFNGEYLMTSELCSSGTDRLIELHKNKSLQADIWVNWQGDEPFINREMIENLLQTSSDPLADVWTLKKKIIKMEESENPQIVKVVCDAKGYALYFSRLPIPYYREVYLEESKILFKHIGIYAFTARALQKISEMPSPCYLEEAEKLEQLRFLYSGLKVQVHETQRDGFGIDLPEHLAQAEEYLLK